MDRNNKIYQFITCHAECLRMALVVISNQIHTYEMTAEDDTIKRFNFKKFFEKDYLDICSKLADIYVPINDRAVIYGEILNELVRSAGNSFDRLTVDKFTDMDNVGWYISTKPCDTKAMKGLSYGVQIDLMLGSDGESTQMDMQFMSYSGGRHVEYDGKSAN